MPKHGASHSANHKGAQLKGRASAISKKGSAQPPSRAAAAAALLGKPVGGSTAGPSLQGRKAAATPTSAASHSIFLSQLEDPHAAFAATLTSLVIECLASVPAGSIPLADLGSKVRELALRRGLGAESEGKVLSLSKHLKAALGGWDGFVAAHGQGAFALRGGVMHGATEANMETGCLTGEAVPTLKAPTRLPSMLSAEDVNSLSLARL